MDSALLMLESVVLFLLPCFIEVKGRNDYNMETGDFAQCHMTQHTGNLDMKAKCSWDIRTRKGVGCRVIPL